MQVARLTWARGERMGETRDDLTLEEFLADPLIRAVMKADGVDPHALAAELRNVAEAIDWQFVSPAPALQECPACCV